MPIRMPDPPHQGHGPPLADHLRSGPQRSAPLARLAAGLARELLEALRRADGAVRVDETPEGFDWREGRDGADRTHLPLARVERTEGDVSYVDAVPRSVLERDPSMGGVRSRVELECAVRGASYEVWTEDEIREDPTAVNLTRVADATERAAYLEATARNRTPGAAPPPIVVSTARRLGLDGPFPCGNAWIGRSRLTGIVTAVLDGIAADPSGLTVWRPHRTSPRTAGADRHAEQPPSDVRHPCASKRRAERRAAPASRLADAARHGPQ